MFLLPQTMQAILDEQPVLPGHSLVGEAVARLEQRFGMTATRSLNARLLADALNAALADPHTRSLLNRPASTNEPQAS